MADRFVEWIEEEDGSRTAVCERPDGSRYELRGCEIMGIDGGEPEDQVIPIVVKD